MLLKRSVSIDAAAYCRSMQMAWTMSGCRWGCGGQACAARRAAAARSRAPSTASHATGGAPPLTAGWGNLLCSQSQHQPISANRAASQLCTGRTLMHAQPRLATPSCHRQSYMYTKCIPALMEAMHGSRCILLCLHSRQRRLGINIGACLVGSQSRPGGSEAW